MKVRDKMMGALMGGNHAPMPAHSTDKRFYQSRKGVTATSTPKLDFPSSMEGHERRLADGNSMSYTSINDKEPTSPERGFAPYQKGMGKMNNSFDRND